MEKRKLPFPTPGRMTEHAFAVLDAAMADAKDDPIALTPAIRLALCWVTVQDLTEPWQIEQFWQSLTNPPATVEFSEGSYMRTRDMFMAVERWKQVARNKGLIPPMETWQTSKAENDERGE